MIEISEFIEIHDGDYIKFSKVYDYATEYGIPPVGSDYDGYIVETGPCGLLLVASEGLRGYQMGRYRRTIGGTSRIELRYIQRAQVKEIMSGKRVMYKDTGNDSGNKRNRSTEWRNRWNQTFGHR